LTFDALTFWLLSLLLLQFVMRFLRFYLPLLTAGLWSFDVSAQASAKPEMPPNFAEAFHAPLSAALLKGRPDSTQLLQMLQPVADAFGKFTDEVLARYRVSDTSSMVMFENALGTQALVKGRYADYVRHLRRSLRLQPAPLYRRPPGIDRKAWALARLAVPDEAAAGFQPALRKAWRGQLDSLPTSYRNDLLNAFKGVTAPSITRVELGSFLATLEQARTAGKGQLDYYTAWDLLDQALSYDLQRRYGATFNGVLYELNPARVVEEAVKIPLRDGVRLSGIVFRDGARPAGQRVPTIVSLSPYPGGGESMKGNVFATNGYVYVYADTRGRRGSEGDYFPYEHDARDFYDLIDWVSKQPWCDGQVATTGGSYLGFDQWQAIRKEFRHPALKAVNPMVAVGFGVDFPRESNIFYPYTLQWARFVSGKDLNEAVFNDYHFWNDVAWKLYRNRLPFVKLDSVAAMPNPFFQRWVSHPDFDGYWRGILPSDADYQSLDLPVLTITGYYDDDQNGALYYYRNHLRLNPKARTTHQLLIGPWNHGGSQWMPAAMVRGLPVERAAQIPIYKQVIEWFDWRLKAKAKPAWVRDNVTYFAVGTGQWRGATSLAAMTHDTVHLYLTSRLMPNPRRKAGVLALSNTKSAAAAIPYRHDVAKVLDSAFVFAQEKPFGDSLYFTSPHNLVFESEPLAKALVLSGAVLPRLYLSLNVPDADFRVTVIEVLPDGRNIPLATSCLRARYRHGNQQGKLMKPNRVERFDFKDNYLNVRRLAAGTRLRFVFEVQNTPSYERNYGFGGTVAKERATGPRLIEAQLQTGAKYPSRVDLPVTGE
jgi:uncharacterized protein